MGSTSTDRFVKRRDSNGAIADGWRWERHHGSGRITVYRLKYGRSNTGVDDGFGNIVPGGLDAYGYEAEDIWADAFLPPWWPA